jgi:hypothetical protein
MRTRFDCERAALDSVASPLLLNRARIDLTCLVWRREGAPGVFMPNYLVGTAPLPRPLDTGLDGQRRIPLSQIVARCLEDWDVESTSSDDEDDFCGWRVGSRAMALPNARHDPAGSIVAAAATTAVNAPRTTSKIDVGVRRSWASVASRSG